MKQFFFLGIIILQFVTLRIVNAQTYDLKSFPPYDPAVRTGVLQNGMKYYIRENKIPEKRAEFYLANNIGAIQENDDQNGLAHFTEHMAFNGTANFPKKNIINYLATIGVKFGRNLNAGTGVEQTVFRVTSVPLLRESIMDSVLLILHDWAHYISFDSIEIEAERGVIREEWRMYGSANMRMSNKLAPIVYRGSKYAIRNVIGDTAVINHFKHQTIKDFYNNWYRTNLQALVIVGDFDANVVEAKVKKLFKDIPIVKNVLPKEVYRLPDNVEPLIGTATDPEATSTDISLIYKQPSVSDSARNLGYMRLKILQRMINIMFVQRMAEISRKENPPFLYAYCRYAGFTRVKDAFTGTAQARNNEALRALTALLTEMERLKQFGFTQSEFDRVKADILRSYESQYSEKDKRKSNELVNANISNFMINYPNPGVEFEYTFAKQMIPGISLDELNTEVKKYVHPENMIVTVTAPEKEGITVPTIQEIRETIENTKNIKLEAYVDSISGKKLIDKEPIPGKVIQMKNNEIFGTTEWVLSNGIKVIFKPTENKADEVLIKGWREGGYSTVDDYMVPSAQISDNIAVESGVGNFSRTDLGKVLAGKRVNISPSVSNYSESIGGYFSPNDVETALQLVYLYFTKPRWSDSDFNTWMDKMRNNFVNMKAEPRKAFSDSITVTLYNHNKRYRPTTYELFDEMSFDKVKAFYHDRFGSANNFMFLFTGKIDPEKVKPIIEKYLGSLPVVKHVGGFKDDGVRFPNGKVVNDFFHENKTPRTSVFIYMHGKCGYTVQDKLYFAAIRHILELRYIETIREEKGGSYHVGVSANVGRLPEPEFGLSMSFDTDPKLTDDLKAIVYRELDKLIKDGPLETDLNKAKEYFLKQRMEDFKENNWWHSVVEEYYNSGLDLLSGYEENVKSLTTKGIQEFAVKMINQGNVVEVIMRPEK